MNTLLQVENLSKRYGINNVVDEVSFALDENTATALIGPNGAGKTTTLSMLAGLVSPTGGIMQFQGGPKTRYTVGYRISPTISKILPMAICT